VSSWGSVSLLLVALCGRRPLSEAEDALQSECTVEAGRVEDVNNRGAAVLYEVAFAPGDVMAIAWKQRITGWQLATPPARPRDERNAHSEWHRSADNPMPGVDGMFAFGSGLRRCGHGRRISVAALVT